MQRTPLPSRRRPSWARGLTLSICASMALATAACAGDDTLRTPSGSPISTTTTRVAEVKLVVPEPRDYSQSCKAPSAPDPGEADVERIVVTDPALLDAICALGLQSKVSAVTAAPGSIPAYVGPQLGAVAAIGPTPSAAAVTAAAPDVVLTTPTTESAAHAFTGVRTVTVDAATAETASWQKQFQDVADALGRNSVGIARLKEFTDRAANVSRYSDAPHTWVSLVRFIGDTTTVAGNDTFAGQILKIIGAQRPAPQRVAESFPVTDKTFHDIDGDIIYVSFADDKGRAYGQDVLHSDPWLNLGASTWARVMVANDELWYRSAGLTAAWLVLFDLRDSLRDGSSAGY